MISKQRSEDPVLSVELLTTLLMVINGLCFAYEMVIIGYVAYQDRLAAALLKKTRKKVNNNSKTSTQVLPVAAVNQEDELSKREVKEWN